MVLPTQPYLALGPLLYLWEGAAWRDFYFRIADEAPLDVVTIGEVVCSKRSHFIAPYLDEVAGRLQRAGKSVRLASLALVTLSREERAVHELAEQDLTVEINDLSALPGLAGRESAAGPFVNVYNAATAQFLAGQGVTAICLPPELPLDAVRDIAGGAPGVDFEIFAFGRVPLAMSARCAHARVKGNTKDNCQFVCQEDPDGLPVQTLDGQNFLALNGIQTMSHTCQALTGEIALLEAAGVSGFRLSPQDCDMVRVSSVYEHLIGGRVDAGEAREQLAAIYDHAPLSNGFVHAQPGAKFVQQQLVD